MVRNSEKVSQINEPHPVSEKAVEAEIENCPNKRCASFRYLILTVYRRLFAAIFAANLIVFVSAMVHDHDVRLFINATAINLLISGLARQPLVVNLIFTVVCSLPHSAPLRMRRLAADVYHYGGVHSGCAVASTVWYIGTVALVTDLYCHPEAGHPISIGAIILSYLLLILLVSMIVVSYPGFRRRYHDCFELTHRYIGWLILLIFLALLLVFSHEQAGQGPGASIGHYLVDLPAFWSLIISISAIIHPWLLLRKVRVRAESLSAHAVRLHFDHTTTSLGKGLSLSMHPLMDWHSFATFPDLDLGQMEDTIHTDRDNSNNKTKGKYFSCIVSKAGDWTTKCIRDPPTSLWKRGVLVHGFIHGVCLFRRVVILTTGSGIGPCLSYLGKGRTKPVAMRLVWQAKAPHKTYGRDILGLVAQLDPNSIILDTDGGGRVDMLPLALRLVKEFPAEAVCVISNAILTRKLVFELESRGVPAYGPIFDS